MLGNNIFWMTEWEGHQTGHHDIVVTCVELQVMGRNLLGKDGRNSKRKGCFR